MDFSSAFTLQDERGLFKSRVGMFEGAVPFGDGSDQHLEKGGPHRLAANDAAIDGASVVGWEVGGKLLHTDNIGLRHSSLSYG